MTSSARLALRTKLGNYETTERALSELNSLIAGIKEAAQSSGIQFGVIEKTGEHRDSYDPEWIPDVDTGIGV